MQSQSDFVTTTEANAEVRALRSYHQTQIREFREACDLNVAPAPQLPNQAALRLHHKLLAEEVAEFYQAILDKDPEQVLDALGDIVYLAYGAAVDAGYDLDAAVDEIHRSNMAKVMPDGTVRRRSDGKILKPDGWTPPDLSRFVEESR